MKDAFGFLKKGLLIGLTGIMLGCSTISVKPTASIDVAYVPLRVDDSVTRNQIAAEVGAGLEATVKKGLLDGMKISFSGREKVYVTPEEVLGFNWINPTRQEYGFDINVIYDCELGTFKAYAKHMCTHQVSDSPFSVSDINGEEYILGTYSLSQLGIRWEF